MSVSGVITLFFIVVFFGCLIGKIKIRNISLDISAVLILSIFVGYILSEIEIPLNSEIMSLFSQIGTSFFISVIGISAGFSLKSISYKNILHFVIGAAIVLIGFVTTKMIGCIDSNISNSLLSGIFCGSMTSSPGLSAVCEMMKIETELSVLGYGVTYPVSVVTTVLYVQFHTRKLKEVRNINVKTFFKKNAKYQ